MYWVRYIAIKVVMWQILLITPLKIILYTFTSFFSQQLSILQVYICWIHIIFIYLFGPGQVNPQYSDIVIWI